MSLNRIFTIFFVLSGFIALSQERKWDYRVIEDLIEEMAEGSDDQQDFSIVTENLYDFFKDPLNLNVAREEDLAKIPLLNTFHIKSLLSYRDQNGPLLTIYELQLIEGFSPNLIHKILPFVAVGEVVNSYSWDFSKSLSKGRHEFLSRTSFPIETPVGYSESSDPYYPGTKIQWLNKYRYNYRQKLLWGLTTEKDPGEQFFNGYQKNGFDFYSGYVQIKDLGPAKNLIIGDYQIQLAQGLVLWSYIANGKSSMVLNTQRQGKGIKKYTSADENSFLRGAAATFAFAKFKLTLFGSLKKFDANTHYDSLSNEARFSSFQLSGIHALESQTEDADAVKELLMGGNLDYQKGKLNAGASFVNYKYSLPFTTDYSPAKQYDFNGAENYNASINLNYRLKNLLFFSEMALSRNGGKALVAGTLLQLLSQFNASILYRNFEKNYQAHFANAFREGSATQNEQGIYLGAEMYPYKKWKLAAYYDVFRFPWLKTGLNAASDGNDFLVQLDYESHQNLNMYWRFKQERKQTSYSDAESAIEKSENQFKSSLRYQISYRISEHILLKNRLEYSHMSREYSNPEKGILMYQDIRYDFLGLPLKITARYALFDTDSYDTRIYAYESDVYQAFSIPAYYDKGNRCYLLIQYQVLKNLSLWLKIAQSYYSNKTNTGSGLNQIDDNKRSDIRFQLRFKL